MYNAQPPPAGTTVIITQRRDDNIALRMRMQQRSHRILILLFFISLGLAFALAFGLGSFNSTGAFPYWYFIFPAIFFVFLIISIIVRVSAARSARAAAASGSPAGVPAGNFEQAPAYIPQAVPVGVMTGQLQPYNVTAQTEYPYATSMQFPPPQAGMSSPCPRCSVAMRSTALGCGHVFCENCAAMASTCPTCFAPVTARIRLY